MISDLCKSDLVDKTAKRLESWVIGGVKFKLIGGDGFFD